jgi:hypothetical protein
MHIALSVLLLRSSKDHALLGQEETKVAEDNLCALDVTVANYDQTTEYCMSETPVTRAAKYSGPRNHWSQKMFEVGRKKWKVKPYRR